MKTYKYKTLDGFLNNCSKNISIYRLFNGGPVVHDKTNKVAFFELSESAKLDAARSFADYVFKSKTAKNILINRLLSGCGDLSLFQCFYISKRAKSYTFSNSLSGEAFRYCLRMFCKR